MFAFIWLHFVTIRGSFKDNLLVHETETNIKGTLNVMNACVKQKVKKLIFASSAILSVISIFIVNPYFEEYKNI